MVWFLLIHNIYNLVLFIFFLAGLRTVHPDRYPSNVAGRLRDRPRLHICHSQTTADDHLGGGKTADPDVPQFAWPAQRCDDRRPTNVRHRLRGNGAELQHCGRRLKSKTAHLQSRSPRTRSSRSPANQSLWPRPESHVAGLWFRWRRWCGRWRWRWRTGVATVAWSGLSSALRSLASSCSVAHAFGSYDTCACATMSDSYYMLAYIFFVNIYIWLC